MNFFRILIQEFIGYRISDGIITTRVLNIEHALAMVASCLSVTVGNRLCC